MSDRTSTIHHHASSANHGDHDKLLTDAENILERLAGGKGGEKAEAIASKIRHAIDASKEKAANIREYVKNGVHHTEKTIQERPWTSVGVAAAAGLGIGLLIGLLSRRGD